MAKEKGCGPTEIRTQVMGFKVPCATGYTIGPGLLLGDVGYYLYCMHAVAV